MKEKIKQIIAGIFSIILVVIMIVFIDVNLIINNLKKISFQGFLTFILIYTGVFLIRSFRLKIIFQGLNLETSFLFLFGSFGIGWSLNEISPGKLGDIVRIEVINEKHNNLNLSQSIYGIAIERFIDLFILFSITLIILLYLSYFNFNGTIVSKLQFYTAIGAIILSGALIFLALLFFKSNWILRSIGRVSVKLKNFLEKFLTNFLNGINNFRKNKRETIKVIITSFIIWILETFTILLIFYFNSIKINIFVVIFAQTITFFSKTFPVTPGGWVISENIGSLFIILFYPLLQYNNILSLFILDHALRILYVFIYGIGASLALNFKIKDIKLQTFDKE